MRPFAIGALGAVLCTAAVASHGAARPARSLPPEPATELVAVYVGSDGLHADPAFRATVREMNVRLRAGQAKAGRRFVSRGASLVPGAEGARADLATVGPFDELALGDVVRNAVTTRYGVTSAPEVVLVERPASRLPLPLGRERVLTRIAGRGAIVAWVRAGAAVPDAAR